MLGPVSLHAQERGITVSLPILSLAHHGLASEARSTAAPYVDGMGSCQLTAKAMIFMGQNTGLSRAAASGFSTHSVIATLQMLNGKVFHYPK
jgi:hypothetical protein